MAGRALVFSGANGCLLRSWDGDAANEQLGAAIAGAGDVNGDGFADLVAGAADPLSTGTLAGYAQILFEQPPELYAAGAEEGAGAGDELGVAVAIAGDLDGDGFDDVAGVSRRNAGSSPGRAFAW